MAKSVVIKILGDSSQFGKATKDVETKLGGFKSKLPGIAAAVGGAFAVDKIVDFGAASLEAAADDAKSQAVLQQTLKNTIGARKADVAAVEDQITKWMNATGVADDQLRPAYANLIRATHDTATANKDMGLALDIAAAKGIDVESVTKAMAKAHSGNVGALGKLGIATKDASGKTLTLDQVMQNASKTFGGSAKAAAETTAGKMARLKVQMGELQEKIGSALMPVVTKLADFFINNVVPAMESVAQWVQNHWPPVQEVITRVIGTIVGFVQDNWPKVQAAIEPVMEAIKTIIHTVLGVIRGIWQNFGGYIMRYIGIVFNNIKTIIQTVIGVIRGIIQVVTSLIKGDWSGVWNGIKKILSSVWEGIKGVIHNGIEAAKTILSAGWKAVKLVVTTVWDKLVDGISGAVDKIKGFFVGIWDGLKAGLKGVANWVIGGLESMVNKVVDLINVAIGGFNSIPLVPDIPKLPHASIPRLAKGGVVTSPTLALIGEAGPEAVVPLGSRKYLNDGGPTVVIQVQGSVITERDLMQLVRNELIKLKRQGFAAA